MTAFDRRVRRHRLTIVGITSLIAICCVSAVLVESHFDWLLVIPMVAVPLLIVDVVRAPKSMRRRNARTHG